MLTEFYKGRYKVESFVFQPVLNAGEAKVRSHMLALELQVRSSRSHKRRRLGNILTFTGKERKQRH